MIRVLKAIRLLLQIAFTPVLIWVVTSILMRAYHRLQLADFAILIVLCILGSFVLVKDDWEAAFTWLLRKWFKDDVHNN